MEKNTTKKADAAVAEAVETEKKPARKCCKKCDAVVYNAETAGNRAGDIYQALAAAEKALTIKQLAQKTKATEEEVLLGMGWLLREGKLSVCDSKVALA